MTNLIIIAVVFVTAFGVGYLLIKRIPSLLHTPLMSMTNAISAVTILGGILLFAVKTTELEKGLGALAIAAAMFNVVGGFTLTDRMVKMFKK